MRNLRFKIILDYLGEANIIPRALIKERQEVQSQRRKYDDGSKGRNNDLGRQRKNSGAQECGRTLDPRKGRKRTLP